MSGFRSTILYASSNKMLGYLSTYTLYPPQTKCWSFFHILCLHQKKYPGFVQLMHYTFLKTLSGFRSTYKLYPSQRNVRVSFNPYIIPFPNKMFGFLKITHLKLFCKTRHTKTKFKLVMK